MSPERQKAKGLCWNEHNDTPDSECRLTTVFTFQNRDNKTRIGCSPEMAKRLIEKGLMTKEEYDPSLHNPNPFPSTNEEHVELCGKRVGLRTCALIKGHGGMHVAEVL